MWTDDFFFFDGNSPEHLGGRFTGAFGRQERRLELTGLGTTGGTLGVLKFTHGGSVGELGRELSLESWQFVYHSWLKKK